MTALVTITVALGLLGDVPPPPSPTPSPSKPAAVEATPKAGTWAKSVKVSGTIAGASAKAGLSVYLPAGYASRDEDRRYPLVIALPGWNHSPRRFRDEADIERWADRYGLVLAIPAMGKTVYETRFYPKSRRKWAAIPGTRWVGEVLLPYLRAHYAVRADRAGTAIIGYSTGGRGALLVASAYPEFAFAGSVSGTFDLMKLDPKDGEYKIHAVIYGSRRRHPERWQLDNGVNPTRLVGLDGTRVFATHGAEDTVVYPNQLEALRVYFDANSTFAVVPGHGHGWAFWNSQWGPMFTALAEALDLGEPAAEVAE